MIDKRLTVSKRRICYINSDTRTLETSVAFFEKRLKLISNVELVQFSTLERVKESGPCDLLIFNAVHLDDAAFLQWFPKMQSKIPNPSEIRTPTLFLSKIEFTVLENLWEDAYKSNWYFDILDPEHIESIPIRVANLLRMHDHLHEIKRYETELVSMKKRLDSLEEKLEKLNPHERR